jgi:hypothetical protein
MSLYLAVKRVSRLFHPRRWVRANVDRLFFYAVGLFTGMYIAPSSQHSDRITYSAMATFLAIIALQWWAKRG